MVSRRSSPAIKVDFTPFVDIALLLTIFFFWQQLLGKPNVMTLYTKKAQSNHLYEDCCQSTIISLYLGDHHTLVCATEYTISPIPPLTFQIETPALSQFLIKAKQKSGDKAIFIIKPMSSSRYKDIVDIIDLLHILKLRRYAFVTPSASEVETILSTSK